VRLCGERIREIFDTAGPRSSESPIRGGGTRASRSCRGKAGNGREIFSCWLTTEARRHLLLPAWRRPGRQDLVVSSSLLLGIEGSPLVNELLLCLIGLPSSDLFTAPDLIDEV
jgi:hypothetical protein